MNAARRKAIAAAVKAAQDAIEGIAATVQDARDTLANALNDEEEYYSNMPEGLQGSENGEAAQECISNLDTLVDALQEFDNVQDALNEYEAP